MLHITDLGELTPACTIQSSYLPPSPPKTTGSPDLDTPDELAVRALLLGILHRTIGEYAVGREFLAEAHRLQVQGGVKVSTWVGGVAMFEMAVLDLKEADSLTARDPPGNLLPNEQQSHEELARPVSEQASYVFARMLSGLHQPFFKMCLRWKKLEPALEYAEFLPPDPHLFSSLLKACLDHGNLQFVTKAVEVNLLSS